MSASRKVVERRCLKLIFSDCSTFHLVLTISNVFQKMYRIGGGETQKFFSRRAKKLVESYQVLRVHHPSLRPDLHSFQVMIT
jgi:hypothetical protein